MHKNGYMNKEYIGRFWSILETRPYMRVKYRYMDILKECGMLCFAISECEDMIRLCENDNLGIRHILMALYAFTENEEKALTLYKNIVGMEKHKYYFHFQYFIIEKEFKEIFKLSKNLRI